MGDGLLLEFASVVDAVRCAVEVQREMAERNADVRSDRRIEFRIGINIGDIIKDGRDIYGDGVNVALRLEALAEPGGICVSRVVRDKLDFTFDDLGEQRVKNIARPIRVHRIPLRRGDGHPLPPGLTTGNDASAPAARQAFRGSVALHQHERRPQQGFGSGWHRQDVITVLPHYPSLFVIARNSTFTLTRGARSMNRSASSACAMHSKAAREKPAIGSASLRS